MDGSCPPSIVDGFASGIRRFGDHNTVVCFIPASAQFKTRRRYANLASRLSTSTSKRCSYTAISKSEDSESGHIAGESYNPAADFQSNSSFFSGRKAILIDEVTTHRLTLEWTARRLRIWVLLRSLASLQALLSIQIGLVRRQEMLNVCDCFPSLGAFIFVSL